MSVIGFRNQLFKTREVGKCRVGFSRALGNPDVLQVSELPQDLLESIGSLHFQIQAHLREKTEICTHAATRNL